MAHIVKYSEAGYIGLHGIIIIAQQKGESMSVDDVAKRLFSSKHHVAKVFQTLVKAGYLKSTRGPSGGFVMGKDPHDISFLEIYELIEGSVRPGICPLDKELCPFDRKCIFNNVTRHLTEEFIHYMSKEKISNYL
jgi:Rrf2 family protein